LEKLMIKPGAMLLSGVLSLAAASAVAAPVVIDFGGLTGPNLSAFPSAYVEDGFTVSPTSGNILQATLFGDPTPSLLDGTAFGVTAPAVVTVTGSTFVFNQADLNSANGTGNFRFQGYLLGSLLFDLNFVTDTNLAFQTFLSGSTQDIDRLVITMERNFLATSMNLDNINLTPSSLPVSLPTTVSLVLLALALARLSGVGRRSA
jgi:hypothetical protein